jgi:hypothetical protein
MSDEAAKLKAELTELNTKCQLARDNEVRFALQRSRLEAERTQLLVKLVEAMAPSVIPTPPAVGPTSPWRVTLQMPTSDNVSRPSPNQPAYPADARRKHKADGLPSIATMITAVLKETPGLRPPEIADFIRKQWWPDLPTPTISTTVWRMVRSGHLTQQDGRYALNGTGPSQNGSGHTVSVVSAE